MSNMAIRVVQFSSGGIKLERFLPKNQHTQSYWGSPLVQFSKFKNFLWVCWFLDKNLSNFVPPVWKLHNPYCHSVHSYHVIYHTNYFGNPLSPAKIKALDFILTEYLPILRTQPLYGFEMMMSMWNFSHFLGKAFFVN